MIRTYFYLILFLLLPCVLSAQKDSVLHRIILIGDAGEQRNGTHPEIEMVKNNFRLDGNTTVLYLGDNIYPRGLPSRYADNYLEKKAILDSQISIINNTDATVYFIPGNHDWMQGRKGGYQQITNQYRYITAQRNPRVRFVPSGPCPGPEEIQISDKITLVVVDSQWWLHRFDKPTVRSGCETRTEAELLSVLKEIVERNHDKLLIFAAHHPFITFGPHGGYYNLKQHIFPLTDLRPNLYIPLPVIGSLYPVVRGLFGNIQDTRHPIYKSFSRAVDSILNRHPYCIRVAGHEHNLQLIENKDRYYIVSGAGAKESGLTKDDGLIFSKVGTGLATLELTNNGKVYVKYFSSANSPVTTPLYSRNLGALDSGRVVKKNIQVPLLPDSVTVPAAEYYTARKLKSWLMGANYRKEWSQPVKMRVFDISKEKGGLKVLRKGPGIQTLSLRLEDKNGREYLLRTVEKFPDATLPEEFRQTIIKDAVVDAISASYPYAALSIPVLSRAAKVPYAAPQLVYVPDDPRLGFYQKEFANKVCMLEESEPRRYGSNTSTEKVFETVSEDHKNKIDQRAVLRARLLDMFIMDFDRHENQWRWNSLDTGGGLVFTPLPLDRDQAFFVNEGVLTKQLRKPWRLPKLQGFRSKAIDITTFNFNARYFDRTFLNGLAYNDWESIADSFLVAMSDTVIAGALRQQPPEVFQQSGPEIIATLQERRNQLKDEALQYYRFLSKEVEITGSEKAEYFDVLRDDDGSVIVKVFAMNESGRVLSKIYDRKFIPAHTKEIRLFGLDGRDSFLVHGAAKDEMRLRITGGEGKDMFINESGARKSKTVVYDYTRDGDRFAGEGVFKKEISDDPSVNLYRRHNFRYDLLHPKASVAYNRDDGLFLGGGIRYTKHGFNKDPYKFLHDFNAQYAFLTTAFRFQYNFEAVGAIGSSDLIVHADVRAPNNTINFFGAGNNTVNNIRSVKDYKFHQTTFFHSDLELLLRREVAPDIHLFYGPTFRIYKVDSLKNRDRYISTPGIIGTNEHYYNTKTYGGVSGALVIDNRNDLFYPSRGVLWKTAIQYNHGLSHYSNDFTSITSDLAIYISSNIPPRMVIALRFGGGINLGNYEFYQSQFLSGTQNLRGYRKYRFAGDRMFYNNLDIRIRLKDYQAYLFTGSYGLLGFHDIGRVWVEGEQSGRWHNGYGVGGWVSPAKRFIFSASLMFSKEGVLPLVNFGFQF